jgi:hypothetical protein
MPTTLLLVPEWGNRSRSCSVDWLGDKRPKHCQMRNDFPWRLFCTTHCEHGTVLIRVERAASERSMRLRDLQARNHPTDSNQHHGQARTRDQHQFIRGVVQRNIEPKREARRPHNDQQKPLQTVLRTDERLLYAVPIVFRWLRF